MTTNPIHRRDHKCVLVGGIRCPCCTPFRPARTKRLLNRRHRRKARPETLREARESISEASP